MACYSMAFTSPLVLWLLLKLAIQVRASGVFLTSVTRDVEGDEFWICNNSVLEERKCPSRHTLGFENCRSDISLRNQYCHDNETQLFLGRQGVEPNLLVVFGTNRTLNVFNTQSNRHEKGVLLERNTVTNSIDKQAELYGCNITSLSLINTSDNSVTRVNHSGFHIALENTDITIQVEEERLYHPKTFYEGEIFQLNISCQSNARLECIIFKFNGTTNFNEDKTCSVTTSHQTKSHNATARLEMTSGSTNFWEDPTIQYIMIGSGCGIGLLICIITILCIGICTLSVKSNNAALIHARRMEMRYNAAQDEDHYSIDQVPSNSVRLVRQSENTENPTTTEEATDEQVEENQSSNEDHMYASVDDAQTEMEEVRQKEATAQKFGYASITFDTFKPSTSRPPSYQPELDSDQRRNRLPSFARNYNPAANRIQLARSYEVVTLMHKPTNEATNGVAGSGKAEAQAIPREEYDTLNYPERKPTLMSQRNFSISQAEYATDYSQLQVQKKTKPKMAIAGEPSNSLYQNRKPVPRQRTKISKPNLHSSYSSVKKSSPPPLPPPYDPMFGSTAQIEEDHYKVPRSQRGIEAGYYDRPSSLVRVARSCENLGRSSPRSYHVEAAAANSIYDMPSSISPPLARRLEMETQDKSLHSLISQDSYIDMSATQV